MQSHSLGQPPRGRHLQGLRRLQRHASSPSAAATRRKHIPLLWAGVCHYLGTNDGAGPWVNPHVASRLTVRASSPACRTTDPKVRRRRHSHRLPRICISSAAALRWAHTTALLLAWPGRATRGPWASAAHWDRQVKGPPCYRRLITVGTTSDFSSFGRRRWWAPILRG